MNFQDIMPICHVYGQQDLVMTFACNLRLDGLRFLMPGELNRANIHMMFQPLKSVCSERNLSIYLLVLGTDPLFVLFVLVRPHVFRFYPSFLSFVPIRFLILSRALTFLQLRTHLNFEKGAPTCTCSDMATKKQFLIWPTPWKAYHHGRNPCAVRGCSIWWF